MYKLLITAFFLVACHTNEIETTPTFATIEPTIYMQMITIEDVVMRSYKFPNESENVGGTISKGTIIWVYCNSTTCFFPDSSLYIPRDSVVPYYNIENDKHL